MAPPPPPEQVILGVDLGTSYSVAAALTEQGVAEVMLNDIGSRTTPSCVHINEGNGQRLVGEAALRMAVGDPAGTVRGVKSILGTPYAPEQRSMLNSVPLKGSADSSATMLKIGSLTIAAEEVASTLLMELKKAAEGSLRRDVEKALIAVPSYFNASQRCAVRHAALLAGFKAVNLVNETTAAAVCFVHDREGTRNVVILDVGGGGGSVAVVRASGKNVKVLANCSAKLPGGDALDEKMMEFLKQAVKESCGGKDVTDPRDVEILRAQWVQAKHKLSRIPKANINAFLPGMKETFRKDVSKGDFENHCDEIFKRISEELLTTLKAAKLSVDDLDDVVLVGGSSRIPRLRQLVQEALPGKKLLCNAVNPDEAVALGAALLAAGTVKVTEERLALLTTVECGKLTFEWPVNNKLPAIMQSVTRIAGKNVEVRQGESPSAMQTVFKGRVPTVAAVFAITPMGTLSLTKPNDKPIDCQLYGCLSTKVREEISKKINKYAKNEEEENQRLKSKNELEGILRQVVARKIVEGDHCASKAEELKDLCSQKLVWLKDNGEADCEMYEKLREEIEVRVIVLEDEIREARERAEAKQSLEEALLSWLTTEDSADSLLCPVEAKKLEDYCSRKLDWLDKNTNVCLHDYREALADYEKKKVQFADAVQKEKERRQAMDMLRDAATLGLDEWVRRPKDICEDKLAWLQANPEATKVECEYHYNQLVSALDRVAKAHQEAVAEKSRQDARTALRNRIDTLNAFAREMSGLDESDASKTFRQQIVDLYNRALTWHNIHQHASEQQFLEQHKSINERCKKALEDLEIARKAARAERLSAMHTLLEKLQSIANPDVPEDHDAREAALELQHYCKVQLENVSKNPELSTQACREILNEAKKREDAVEKMRVEEHERRQWLTKVQTSVRAAQEKYNCGQDILSIADSIETWLGSNVTPDTEKLKHIHAQMSEIFDKYDESLRLDEAAEQARQLCKEKTKSLLVDLGFPVVMHTPPSSGGCQQSPALYSPQDFEEDPEPMETNEPDEPLATDGDLDCLLQPMDASRIPKLLRLAEARAVEALQAAQAAGCMALMLYKTVIAERERVSLCVRFVPPDGVPVEEVLLVRAADGPSPPKGPVSCARLLVGAFCRLCELAGMNWRHILLGVSVVGAGQEGRAFKEELSRAFGEEATSPIVVLEDCAVRLSQRLVDSIQEGVTTASSYSSRFILGNFFDTIDTLKTLFTFGEQTFQLLKSKCSSLKDGENPWMTYESAVNFLSSERTTAIESALRELAVIEPTKRKTINLLCVEIDIPLFRSCAATCNVVFNETRQFAKCAENLDIMTLPGWNKHRFSGSALKQREALLLPLIRKEMDVAPSRWGIYYEGLLTDIVSLCTDLIAGLLDASLLGLRNRIILLEEIWSVKEKRNPPRHHHSLQTLSKAAVKDLAAFKDHFADRTGSLHTMMDAMPGEEFREHLPHLYCTLLQALTAPLTPTTGPRSIDLLRRGGRFALPFVAALGGCADADEVVQAVIVLAAHLKEPSPEPSQSSGEQKVKVACRPVCRVTHL